MAYGIRKIRRMYAKNDPVQVLIEEHNKLVDDLANARTGAAVTASKIADQNGKDESGATVV
jgi:hypothetical protein